jgi:hypothetical protein
MRRGTVTIAAYSRAGDHKLTDDRTHTRLEQRVTFCLSTAAYIRLTAMADAEQAAVGQLCRRAVLQLLDREKPNQPT